MDLCFRMGPARLWQLMILPPFFLLAALLSLVIAGCAPAKLVLPQGPGTAYPGYSSLFDSVVSECRGVRTYEAMIAVRGRGGNRNFRGRVRAGLAAPGSVRLEGLAPFGAPGFYLVATPAEAILWLTREGRVLTDVPAGDMLAGLTGIPFGPEDLRAVLTGCLVPDPQPMRGRSYGEWVVVELMGGAVAYLRPTEDTYRLVAGTRDGLTIEYGSYRRNIPTMVRIFSNDLGDDRQTTPSLDVTASLSQLNLNVELESGTFFLSVPADVSPMTLEDLRRAGPLRAEPDPL